MRFHMIGRGASFRACIWVAVLLGSGLVATKAFAVSVTNAYLFSDFSTTPGPSGSPVGVNPPFSFTASDGVQLTLNGSGTATGAVDVGTTGPFGITSALTFQARTGTIDFGEGLIGGTLASHVNSEVGRLDDVGIVNEGLDDALLNVDFRRFATVTFAIPTGGYTHLVIAEDAGLDPFRLQLCSDASCGTAQTLFNGFNLTTQTNILNRPDFAGDDFAPDIDQLYLFLFDQPATGYFKISEANMNIGNSSRLEIDFAGGSTPAPVPEPGTLLLVGSGLAGLGYRLRKRLKIGGKTEDRRLKTEDEDFLKNTPLG